MPYQERFFQSHRTDTTYILRCHDEHTQELTGITFNNDAVKIGKMYDTNAIKDVLDDDDTMHIDKTTYNRAIARQLEWANLKPTATDYDR